MAVVTEPAWINMTSGTAARNGTSSHTIPFGWTAATGTFLVVIVNGAVTHTNSGGWTERLQPVVSAELSVFTKAGAGESSITLTHNGSNYPVHWVAYEFPAGTTWTAGTSNSPSGDTFPALTGLPGTEQVVIAARGRAQTSTDSFGSSTWAAPWVEDIDISNGFSSTDGVYLTVGHQLNVTAASITPVATTTYTGGQGVTDRQHVVFALNVAAKAPTTPTQPWASLHIGATNITSLNLGSTLLWQA